MSCRGGVGHVGVGWGGVGHAGGWGVSCRSGVGHVEVGLGVGVSWRGGGVVVSCRGGVGHAGVWWGGSCRGGWVGYSCRGIYTHLFMSDSNSENNNSYGFEKFTNGYKGMCMSRGKFLKP